MRIFKWKYRPNGNCPVQAEGTFLGHYFYFRSRWETASIEFAETEEDWDKWKIIKRFELKHYGGFEAGWISGAEATRLVYIGCMSYIIHRIGFALGLIKKSEPPVFPTINEVKGSEPDGD